MKEPKPPKAKRGARAYNERDEAAAARQRARERAADDALPGKSGRTRSNQGAG